MQISIRLAVFYYGEESMKDIRVREKDKGTIRSLDKTAAAAHRIKDASVRVRSDLGIQSDSDDNSSAADAAENYARTGAVYAAYGAKRAAGRVKRGYISYAEKSEQPEIQETGSGRLTGKGQYNDTAHRSFQKSVRDRGSGKAAAANEIKIKGSESFKAHGSSSDAASMSQSRQKQHGIKKLTERLRIKQSGRLFRTHAGGRASSSSARRLRSAIAGSKELVKALTASGTLCLGIVLIMIIFGAAISMTEEGNYLSGEGDTAIVEVARAELGNKGGDKFWKWYGFKSHVDWCAIFVSWCADKCGYIKEGIIPKFSVVGDGARWFKARHRWAGRGYTPKPGDLIFFDYEGDGILDHAGIVEICDGKRITTIEGNSGNMCRRQSYAKGSSLIAGYGCPEYVTISLAGGSASAWAAKIAADNSYHYVHWAGSDARTQQCPICHKLTANRYKGWNCIGFAFACWRHGYGINSKCSCGVINNSQWNRLLRCRTDAEANRMASRLVGVRCVVIRNGGKAIPLDMLKSGDIFAMFSGNSYFHTAFYEGNGRYADCTSGRSDNIQSNNKLSGSARLKIKVAIRFAG